MNRLTRLIAGAMAGAFICGGAVAQPIEAFVRQPEIRSAAISPNGQRIAAIGHSADGAPYFVVRTLGGDTLGSVLDQDFKLYGVQWVGDGHFLITVGVLDTVQYTEAGSRIAEELLYEVNWTLVVDIDNLSARDAFTRIRHQLGVNTSLANVRAVDHEGGRVFISAWSSNGTYDLFEINVADLSGDRVARGNAETQAWIVGSDFEVAARQDYDNRSDREAIYAYPDGSRAQLLAERTTEDPRALLGIAPDGRSVVLSGMNETIGLYAVSLEGGDAAELYRNPDYDALGAQRDPYRGVLVSTSYADDVTRSYWFDEELGAIEAALSQAFGDRHVSLGSWDRARERFLLWVEGEDASAEFYLFDAAVGQADSIGLAFPELAEYPLARRSPYSYSARDGATIPAYLTTPAGFSAPAPLVVLPHGGPESRDLGGYDWMAHLFASRGYLVLQPNFRGSTGYGAGFRDAGRGEWGGLMQDDVTDGVQRLIDEGLADPDRICIVGWSYGGYAALAGAAKTPDLYQCVVAIAAVTDLPDQINYARDRYGSRNWVIAYWRQVIGDLRADNDRLVAASPARRAGDITAPVLLVHGDEDTTVPVDQSETMYDALRRAGADVEFVRMRGDDHQLYKPAVRLEAMQAVVAFLEEHLE